MPWYSPALPLGFALRGVFRRGEGRRMFAMSYPVNAAPAAGDPARAYSIEPLEPRRLLAAVVAGEAAVAPELAAAGTTRVVENLDRGVVAMRTSSTQVFVSWRLLGLDPAGVGFNLYRSANGAAPVKVNASPLTGGTNYVDGAANLAATNVYHVRPVVDGVEGAAGSTATLPANAPVRQYLNVPLQIPAGGTTPDGVAYTYSAGDTSVGDVDGDGDYEFIVKWDPSNAKDNSQDGYTGNVYVDAYTIEGTRLWRIDLGRNIRAGAHYTQFIVYDLDSDGRAEVAMKTADGAIDGAGAVIGSPTADWRNADGYILSGPEYLTVFNGQTGAAMSTVSYVPPRGSVSSWGDGYGNRVDRFLAGVAYLDGQHPSLVMARGYYTRAVVVAWDWRNGELTRRWTFDSDDGTAGNSAYRGQGTHSLGVSDVDNDGRDEIVYGAATIDDNGRGLSTSGLGHGDALHVSDMDPSRPGQEVFQVHEGTGSNGHVGASVRDGATSQVLVSLPVTIGADGKWPDVGRGLAMDVDPRSPGYEFWDSYHPSLYGITGDVVAANKPSRTNFGVWWDADPLRELLDGTTIDKWSASNNSTGRVFTAYQAAPISSINGTKSTPNVSGDLFGDWREEVVWRAADNASLYVFTTTIPTARRLPTLMHDTQYRTAIAWQNVAYNQPPHPSFFLGDGMATPPAPNVRYAGADVEPAPGPVYPAEEAWWGGGTLIESNNGGFNGTGFANFPTNGGFLEFSTVDGGAAGDAAATLRFRYANGNATARTGTVTINGVAQPITFTPTGGWTNWQELTVTTPLNPGRTNVVRLASTGADLGNVDELVVARTPDAAPTVTEVFVNGTGWNPSFDSFLASSGQGDATYGYRLPAANHLNELPWTNVNEVSVRFSEGVNVSADDLVIRGVNVATYAALTMTYDTATLTATWSLPAGTFFGAEKLLLDLNADAGGITDASGNALDGEWTNPTAPAEGGADSFPSGNGTPGGDFQFRLNVLPGDVNGTGSILGSDVTLVRNAQGSEPGFGLYTIFKDVNGSGSILGSDVTLVRNRQGASLPAEEPVAPTSTDSAAIFTTGDAPIFATGPLVRSAMQRLDARFDLLGDELSQPLVG